MLEHAVRASRWQRRAGIRVAAEAVRPSQARAEALDVELGKTRDIAGVSSLHVFGAVRARIRMGPVHRGESSECDGGACAPCTAAPRSPPRTANCMSSALRLSCRSCNRESTSAVTPHQVRSSLAELRWVRCSRGGQGASGVLVAVGVGGRVVGPKGLG